MTRRVLLLVVLSVSLATVVFAQNNGQAQGQPGSGGSFPFAGVTYDAGKLSTVYPATKRTRIIWYKLAQADEPQQSTQPLVLIPMSCDDVALLPSDALKHGGFDQHCHRSVVWPMFPDRRNPLLDGDNLVVGIIDPRDLVAHGQYKVEFVALSVQESSANPLNPAPQRPAISPPGQITPPGPGGKKPVSKCEVSLTGDHQRTLLRETFPVSPALTITVDRTPQANVPVTFAIYPSGPSGEVSGAFQSPSPTKVTTVTVPTDNTGVATAPHVIAGPVAGVYKVAATASCPVDRSSVTADFALTNIAPTYYLAWDQQLDGDTRPILTITVLYATPAPQSSKAQPTGPAPMNAADQAVISAQTQLTQVHPMYAFNLSFGVVGSTLREPSFTRTANSPPCPMGTPPPGNSTTGACGTYTNAMSNSPAVQPVVFFTTYVPQRFDAESRWRPLEMIWPVAPSFGISLTQPSTDFFFGQSSEVRRGVELVYGWHAARVNYVLGGEDPTSSAPPPTGIRFRSGFFYGLSFTLNFVQSLFSGGAPK